MLGIRLTSNPVRKGAGGRAFEEPLAMSARIAFLCLSAGLLLSGCGLFSSDRYAGGTDPDAQRRAEDPYHTDPKYMNPDEYNRNMDGKNTSIISMLFSNNETAGNSGGGGPGIGVNSF